MTHSTIEDLLGVAVTRLMPVTDSAVQDAKILLAHVIQQPTSYIMARPDHLVQQDESNAFLELISRRETKEPIAYIVGHKEFWSMELRVAPTTLIPRPETETLVEYGLMRIRDDDSFSVADLGTGSGAIALAIAKENSRTRIHATDVSVNALSVAKENRHRLGLRNVFFHHVENWLPNDYEPYDLLISNPPYVASSHENLIDTEITHEPRTALVAGADGLDAIRDIAELAPSALKPQGWLLLEHGFDQRAAVREILEDAGFDSITCYQDLAGVDRVTEGRLVAGD